MIVGVSLRRKDAEDATMKGDSSASDPDARPVVEGWFDSYKVETLMPMKATPKVVWMLVSAMLWKERKN